MKDSHFASSASLFCGCPAMAATWFVDGIHGSDTNSCKSPQQACKTIGQAISLASWGDSVMIAAG